MWCRAVLALLVVCAFAVPASADEPPPLDTCETEDWTITTQQPQALDEDDCDDYDGAGVCKVCGGDEDCQVWAIEFEGDCDDEYPYECDSANSFGVLVPDGSFLGADPTPARAAIGEACTPDAFPFGAGDLINFACHEMLIEWELGFPRVSNFEPKVLFLKNRNVDVTTAAAREEDEIIPQVQACALRFAGSEIEGQAANDSQVGMAGECEYKIIYIGDQIFDVELIGGPAACRRVPIDSIQEFSIQLGEEGSPVPVEFVQENNQGNVWKTNENSCYWFRTATGQMIGIGNPDCP